MMFQWREFFVPKDYDTPQYYEDACAINEDAGRVAIADGVSSAVFSAAWAQILTRSVAANPPNVRDEAEFAGWLAERRKEWAAGIHVPSLPYHLLMKLRQVGGGFATLAWIDVERCEQTDCADAGYVVRGQGVGDSCVFHVRNGQLLAKWPMQTSADFESDPISVGSVNFQRDQGLEFQEFEWQADRGDLIVLATDAIADWVYKMVEAGEVVNWDDLSHLPDVQLAEYITALRESHWLKRDDTTLVFLGLGRSEPFLSTDEPIVNMVATDISPAVADESATAEEITVASTAGEANADTDSAGCATSQSSDTNMPCATSRDDAVASERSPADSPSAAMDHPARATDLTSEPAV